ncbi:MAG: response regulator [Deltaproteobacteria bacterium]|nr:response regulator [Deltaproteobacteria bacterium]
MKTPGMISMDSFIDVTLHLVSQFTGGHGGIAAGIVPFGLGAALWGTLLVFSLTLRRSPCLPRERMLVWGFGLGLTRELVMLVMAALPAYGIVDSHVLHVIFPPLEHALFDAGLVVVAGAFLLYPGDDQLMPRRFVQTGLGLVLLCYLASFWWWGNHITGNPDSQFGQTWCDWLFRMNASVIMAAAIAFMLARTRGWVRNVVSLAFVFLFLNEFLKIPDMLLGETYEHVFTPLRHGLYMAAIPLFGYVYIRELWEERERGLGDLLESEERYRSLFENSRDAICICGNGFASVVCNRAMLDLTGYSDKEMHYITILDLLASRNERIILQHELDTYGSVKDFDLKLRHKCGRLLDCRLSATLRRDKVSGDVIGYQSIIRDMTERNRVEAMTRQAGKMEAMGTLAGGIAHDFNNILAAILGYANSALRQDHGNGPVTEMLREVIRSGQRARDLVRQILTYSRNSDKQVQLVDLCSLVREVLGFLRIGFPGAVEIYQDISPDCRSVLADPIQIHQVLMNLCTNALQAMDGKGIIVVRLKNVTVPRAEDCPPGLALGHYVKIEVIDNGRGMDKLTQEKIFDPFFTTREIGKGTGMGLASVQGIVAAHNGTITVSSAVGKGSTFTVYFPASEGKAESVEPVRQEFPKGNERILFVDDERSLAGYGAMLFEELGYTVYAYTDSAEALAFLRAHPWGVDLVITDLNMPGMSGIEFAGGISEIRPGLPVILSSGYSVSLEEERFNGSGVKAFLLKPVDEFAFSCLVRKMLDEPGGNAGEPGPPEAVPGRAADAPDQRQYARDRFEA